ncbi:hypothetical protein DF286_10500 [Sphingosinicella humi]|uniref:Terminase n=2 Tax=Allosphingosinicella humi TaxID=2068657 RepID=A0A2U2J4G9_9SPHN|nr:hypothetical protein DF286_10500 [Sphingosinicella humi]
MGAGLFVVEGDMTKADEAGAGEEVILSGGRKPRVRRPRRDGWTAERQRLFLDELAATCNVQAAVRAAGMKPGMSVYALRKRSAAFRAEWAKALAEGYAKLELALLDRAMNGTVKTVERGNGIVDKTREYPNGLAIQLLKLHREGAAMAEVEAGSEEVEEVRRRVVRKLSALEKRLSGEDGGA